MLRGWEGATGGGVEGAPGAPEGKAVKGEVGASLT